MHAEFESSLLKFNAAWSEFQGKNEESAIKQLAQREQLSMTINQALEEKEKLLEEVNDFVCDDDMDEAEKILGTETILFEKMRETGKEMVKNMDEISALKDENCLRR